VQATRIHRLAEAVRTGRVVTAAEKAVMVDLLGRLSGWTADVATDAAGDIALYGGAELRVIRGDGDGYRVLDGESRLIGRAPDAYAATWTALAAGDRARLARVAGDGDALRRAVWKLAEDDASVFRRHGQVMADAESVLPTLCRVRRIPGGSAGCASGVAAAVPQAAKDAKSAIEAMHALAERSPRQSVSMSMSSSASGSSVRSQSLGNANLAALVVASDIKLPNRRDMVTFPKLDQTNRALHQRALVSQSSGGKDGPEYLIFASKYNDASLPQIAPQTSILDQVNSHNRNGGVSIPGRNFRYQVQLAKGGKLALNRPSDTEAAILEYVADQIKRYIGSSSRLPNPRLTGKLVIYTELAPCDSCQNIIRQFQATYPGIELDVYFSFKGHRERTTTPLVDADIHRWQKP
jgi:The  BURPS668_1122 family of deaminases